MLAVEMDPAILKLIVFHLGTFSAGLPEDVPPVQASVPGKAEEEDQHLAEGDRGSARLAQPREVPGFFHFLSSMSSLAISLLTLPNLT